MNTINNIPCQPLKPQQQTFKGDMNADRLIGALDVLGSDDVSNSDRFDSYGTVVTELNEHSKSGVGKILAKAGMLIGIGTGAAAIGTAGARGILKLADKVKFIDPLAKGANKLFTKVGDAVEGFNPEAGKIKMFVAEQSKKAVKAVEGFARKGAVIDGIEDAAQQSEVVAKNGVKKAIGVLAGAGSGVGAVAEATKDENKDKVPDMFQQAVGNSAKYLVTGGLI